MEGLRRFYHVQVSLSVPELISCICACFCLVALSLPNNTTQSCFKRCIQVYYHYSRVESEYESEYFNQHNVTALGLERLEYYLGEREL